MTVPSTQSRNDYVGTGGVDTYQYNFRIFNKTHLLVTVADTLGIETTLTVDVDYTVSGVRSFNGGSIVLLAGNLASGYDLTIRRVVPLLQDTDLRNQGGYFPETVEEAIDYITYISQQFSDALDRTLTQPETEAGTGLTLPTISDRANQFLGFDGAGDPIAAAAAGAPVTAFMQTVLDDTTASAARTTLGLGSTQLFSAFFFDGTNNALECTSNDKIGTILSGDMFVLNTYGSNTVINPTLSINGSEPKEIRYEDLSNVGIGDFRSSFNHTILVKWNSSSDRWLWLNPIIPTSGTFTPSFRFGSTPSFGIVYLLQSGTYKKIGSIVHVDINIAISNNGTSTGSFYIIDLPFTASAAPYASACVGYIDGITYTGHILATNIGSQINMYEYNPATGVRTSLTEASVPNSSAIQLSLTYSI